MTNWKQQECIIAPSVLAADFSNLEKETNRALKAGADWLHLDVMDGNFVDNISFGPDVVKTFRELTDAFLDVHLMISKPDKFLTRFLEAGSDMITVHLEADHDVGKTLSKIRKAGCKAGLALNPSTPLSKAMPFFEKIDLLLCMTVVPGHGGQAFMPKVMKKVKQATNLRSAQGLYFHIEVDGGINFETAKEAISSGANVLVAGSSTFQAPDMQAAISALRQTS